MTERRRSTGSFEVARTTGSYSVVDRLFVYGTMRQGQTARSLIANQIARCVPAAMTGAIYVFPMGYPAYSENDGNGVVAGEVLWLTELAATFGLLDAFEGADFVRIVRPVTLETGEETWAWIYTLADPGAVRHGALIPHGDWVRYWNETI
jgi:gamma-glutamylcyclotransferase (GGCT)/AIG2-like uncharacterized protein YtfP